MFIRHKLGSFTFSVCTFSAHQIGVVSDPLVLVGPGEEDVLAVRVYGQVADDTLLVAQDVLLQGIRLGGRVRVSAPVGVRTDIPASSPCVQHMVLDTVLSWHSAI